ncbi:MAG: hypothetical protein PHV82_01875 [Victivallaceae bacterium]|nr:hypothetical protein [Victivallaceae bacterium]
MSLSITLLVLNRAEMILFVALAGLLAFKFDICAQKYRFPWRSLTSGLIALILISPFLFYVWQNVGYPVGNAHIAIMLKRTGLIQTNPTPRLAQSQNTGVQNSIVPIKPARQTETCAQASIILKRYMHNIASTLKGFYPLFLIFALPVIYLRIKRKQWRAEEYILLWLWLGHYIVLQAQQLIYEGNYNVHDRYLISAAPLAFGWTALGMIDSAVFLKTKGKIARLALYLMGTLMFCWIIYNGSKILLKEFWGGKKTFERDAQLTAAQWIREDFKGQRADQQERGTWCTYLGRHRPIIECPFLKSVGYLAGGQNFYSSAPLSQDYLITDSSCTIRDPENYSLARSFSINNRILRIYKRVKK